MEFAWRVHPALDAGIGKVDIKASILLAFQGGGFVYTTTSPEVLAAAERLPGVITGVRSILVIAMALSAIAILPFLGSSRRHRADHLQEWIYFGHVRLWQAVDLATRLSQLSEHDELVALSAQLVRMSRINWRKHRLLQVSVLLSLLAMAAMMVAMTPRAGI